MDSKFDFAPDCYTGKQNDETHHKEALDKKNKQISELEKDLERCKKMIVSLSNTITILAKTMLKDEQRLIFLEKLNDFLQDKEANFQQFTDRIYGEEANLSMQKELKGAEDRYRALLKNQENHTNRLKCIIEKSRDGSIPKITSISESLSKNGLYAPLKQDETSASQNINSSNFSC